MSLKSDAAAEKPKYQLSRDFLGWSIFDFCNSIGTFRTWLILQAMSDLGGIAEVALRRWVRKNRDQKGLFDRTKRLFVSFISACWWRFRSSSSNSRMISRDRSDSIITNLRWRSGFISSG
jgi:hypothetical protein